MHVSCISFLLHVLCISSPWQASACYTDTTPTQPHRNSNTHRNKNTDQCSDTIEKSQATDDGCINVRNMLSIEEVKQNLITSDIKLVSYSSTITMTHSPIYVRLLSMFSNQHNLKFSIYTPSNKHGQFLFYLISLRNWKVHWTWQCFLITPTTFVPVVFRFEKYLASYDPDTNRNLCA